MSEKHTPVETFDCQGCRPFCYGGYHMEADKHGLGDYVKVEDFREVEKQRDELLAHLEAMVEEDDGLMAAKPAKEYIAKLKGGAA